MVSSIHNLRILLRMSVLNCLLIKESCYLSEHPLNQTQTYRVKHCICSLTVCHLWERKVGTPVYFIDMVSGILRRTPQRYQDPVLWAWLEIIFTPTWGTNSKRTQFLLSFFFFGLVSKIYCRSSQWGGFEAEHDKMYRNHFLTPKGTKSTPSFYMRVPLVGKGVKPWNWSFIVAPSTLTQWSPPELLIYSLGIQ